MPAPVHIELDAKGARIECRFPYSNSDVMRMRQVSGRKFVDKDRDDKHWSLPMDLEVCHLLRELFEDRLVIGDRLRSWAINARRTAETLGSIANAEDATLHRLPTVLPQLAADLRNYQRAGVHFLATAVGAGINPLVADQPGLGKTWEVIAAIFEAGLEEGVHLVVAPQVALESVWGATLRLLQPWPVYVVEGTKAQRNATIAAFEADHSMTKWLVVNPQMITYRKDPTNTAKVAFKAKKKEYPQACHCTRLVDPHWHYVNPYPVLSETVWDTLTVDEAHKGAIRNPTTLTAKAMYAINALTKFALTGTPITKKAIDLWGILHFLNPTVYTSKWNWAGQFCQIDDNGFGKVIGGLLEEKKPALYRSLMPYVLRRTKAEVAPELPDKQYVDLWVDLEGKQLAQYRSMVEDGYATVADGNVSAQATIDLLTRLRQFANAYCTMRDGKVIPTTDSAKVPALLQCLDERGIFDEGVDPAQAEKVVIFTQFREMAEMLYDLLREKGAEVDLLTGKQNKRGQRADIQERFQAEGGTQVLIMTTTAGGVAITLDRADTVIFMDETWSYADKEQAEDRAHRISRMHQVIIITIRARNTVDEVVEDTVLDKKDLHDTVLDLRRKAGAL